MQTITGDDIQQGDVIKSAAMSKPERVAALNISSTGNTMEIDTVTGHFYRIGRTSKVRLVERIQSGDVLTSNGEDRATVTYVNAAQNYVEIQYVNGEPFRARLSDWRRIEKGEQA